MIRHVYLGGHDTTQISKVCKAFHGSRCWFELCAHVPLQQMALSLVNFAATGMNVMQPADMCYCGVAGKYLEIFGRKNNLRNYWVTVGNEVTGTGLPTADEAALKANKAIPGAVYGARN